MSGDILVSVIITTKNEEKNIENCLLSVTDQEFPKDRLEIIVVDNNSSDATKKIAAQYSDKVFDKGPERSAQRNYGAEVASGRYMLYLDADMILSKTVVSECVESAVNGSFMGMYIPETIVGTGYWIKVRNFERGFYNATCIDAARFMFRDAFLSIGGFDLSLTGPEDWDLDRRLLSKGKAGIINGCLFHNEGDFNIDKYKKKKAYYVGSFSAYIDKWGKNDVIVRKQLGLYYRYFGVFIEKGKWKRLVSHPLLAFGLYWLRFLVGIEYLKKAAGR